MARVSFNNNIEEELVKKFDEVVNSRAYVKYRAIQGAVRAFLLIPSDLQTQLIENDKPPKDIFIDYYRNGL